MLVCGQTGGKSAGIVALHPASLCTRGNQEKVQKRGQRGEEEGWEKGRVALGKVTDSGNGHMHAKQGKTGSMSCIESLGVRAGWGKTVVCVLGIRAQKWKQA